MTEATRNTPASAMAEIAPKPERAIRSRLDDAVDATFPASDPVAMTDPARRIEEPRLPAHAMPGDTLSPRGQLIPSPAPTRQTTQRQPADVVELVLRAMPWILAGFVFQRWWMHRRR